MSVSNLPFFFHAHDKGASSEQVNGHVRSCTIALAAVAVAVIARLAVDPIAHEKAPFLFFAFAVVTASLYGGFPAGVTAVVLSLVAGDYLFIEPRYTFFIYDTFGDSVLLVLFSVLGVALSFLVERLNRATQRLRDSEVELTRTNDLLQARQDELQSANERFRMAADAANEVIWEMNLQTHSASWSDLYARSFGWKAAQCSIEGWFNHVHPDDQVRVRASFMNALNGADLAWVCEYRLQRSDSTCADVHNRASISRDRSGTALRVVGAVLDVTENKRAREELDRRTEELVRSNEHLRRFAFAVSHDLQAPLRMVGEYCRQLVSAEATEERHAHIQRIQESADRMRTMIQDLLEFAQVSSQPAAPEVRTDSGAIVGLALQHLQFRIQETGAQITVDPLPAVMVNDSRLLRVFQNLISNAMKYCDRTPEIYISARCAGDMCVFAIKDNGIGIAKEECGRIFGIFERLHGKDRYPGTGIGLPLVKRIIESYGGRLWVESEAGRGSTFYFTLRGAEPSVAAHGA